MSNLVKYYESPVTKRRVALNLHPTDFLWLEVPTPREFEALLLEHERVRIAEAWREKLMPQREGEQWIEAFQPVPAGSLRFFVAGVLKERLAYDKTRGLSEHLRELPLDKQRQLLQDLLPQSRAALAQIASVMGVREILGPDFRQDFLRDSDPRRFVADLVHTAQTNQTARGEFERYTEVLSMLRARGWLLFSLGFTTWQSAVKWRAAANEAYSGDMANLMRDISAFLATPDGKARGALESFGCGAVLMSSMQELSDMSAEWIEEVETQYEQLFTSLRRAAPRQGRALGKALRSIWNHRHPERFIEPKKHLNRKDVRMTSGTFEWLEAASPHLADWVPPLAAYVAQRPSHSKTAVVADLNYFGKFLQSLKRAPASPLAVDRRLHINDVTLKNRDTLMFRLSQDQRKAKYKTRVLSYLRDFFAWYPDWLHSQGRTSEAAAFTSPVSQLDRFTGDDNPGQTFRTALPSWLLKVMRKTLTEDHFAFSRDLDAKTDWVKVFNRDENKVVRQWWPGTAVALLTMLELPLRSHQVRWLDSGVLDEKSLDHTTGGSSVNGHTGAVAGRRQSCLRMLHDTLRQETWCGLFVNTNKTATYDGRRAPGYEIPYLTPELAGHLANLRDWGLRYLPPLSKPIVYSDTGEGRRKYPKAEASKLPQVAPLFRDPSSEDKLTPISYDKLATAYVRLLAETEKRVKQQYGIDISLTKLNSEGRPTWKYDMHTLRVSGITAMLESGVPLEIVSQFVAGHASLVMTLWYFKNSPGQLREAIRQAQDKAMSEGDFVGSAEFMEQLEELSPFLLTKDGGEREYGGDVAYSAMKAHSGLWTISSDGICPGTSCATGGEQEESGKAHGPVPGGRRCGLCRYWITGPAFILGQVAEANNLIYQIRRKGQELAEAKDLLIEQTDDGQHSKSRQTRSRIEALERELTIDITEWQSRYAYAMSSSKLLDEYVAVRKKLAHDKSLPAPLLTSSSEADLHITLQETHEFVLIDHVTQMVDFLPGFKNREAVQEKHLILSRVLEANNLPQFLLQLDAEQSETAANLMSSLILQYVKAQDLTSVLSGERKLADIPRLHADVKQLAAAAAMPSLTSGGKRLIPIRSEA